MLMEQSYNFLPFFKLTAHLSEDKHASVILTYENGKVKETVKVTCIHVGVNLEPDKVFNSDTETNVNTW